MTREAREFLRHAIATLAYRGGKALRNAPEGFSNFRAAPGSRSAGEILAHVGDLFEWGLSIAKGKERWRDSKPRTWHQDVERFHEALTAFDAHVASDEPLGSSVEKLFQGPVADALTHIGQINMLRRLAGSPVRGESYYRAEITTGRVGPNQAKAVREFD